MEDVIVMTQFSSLRDLGLIMMIYRGCLAFRNILVQLYLSILLGGLATELEQTFRPEALVNATVL